MYRLRRHPGLLENVPGRSCGSPCDRFPVYVEQRVVVAAVAPLHGAESALCCVIVHPSVLKEAVQLLQRSVGRLEEKPTARLLSFAAFLFALALQLLSSVLAVLQDSALGQQVAA